jgi:hypothetical protein
MSGTVEGGPQSLQAIQIIAFVSVLHNAQPRTIHPGVMPTSRANRRSLGEPHPTQTAVDQAIRCYPKNRPLKTALLPPPPVLVTTIVTLPMTIQDR